MITLAALYKGRLLDSFLYFKDDHYPQIYYALPFTERERVHFATKYGLLATDDR